MEQTNKCKRKSRERILNGEQIINVVTSCNMIVFCEIEIIDENKHIKDLCCELPYKVFKKSIDETSFYSIDFTKNAFGISKITISKIM